MSWAIVNGQACQRCTCKREERLWLLLKARFLQWTLFCSATLAVLYLLEQTRIFGESVNWPDSDSALSQCLGCRGQLVKWIQKLWQLHSLKDFDALLLIKISTKRKVQKNLFNWFMQIHFSLCGLACLIVCLWLIQTQRIWQSIEKPNYHTCSHKSRTSPFYYFQCFYPPSSWLQNKSNQFVLRLWQTKLSHLKLSEVHCVKSLFQIWC